MVQRSFSGEDPPIYLLQDEKLYLLQQSQWTEWLLVDYFNRVKWTSDKLRQTLGPSEWNMLPDPKAKNGGVAWIRE